MELGFWVAAPAAGGLRADRGAEVIKIESPGGDSLRGLLFAAAALRVLLVDVGRAELAVGTAFVLEVPLRPGFLLLLLLAVTA